MVAAEPCEPCREVNEVLLSFHQRQEAAEEDERVCRESAHLREQAGPHNPPRIARRQHPRQCAYHSAHDEFNPLEPVFPLPSHRLYFHVLLMLLPLATCAMLSPLPEAAVAGDHALL